MTTTQAQAFSLNEHLSDYPDDMTYADVIYLIREHDDRVTPWIWFEHTPPETLIENIDNTLSHFQNVTAQTAATLQVVWEQLNGALHDITDGDPADAQGAIEDCIIRLEVLGIGK
jgi:hypothetical protein